VFARVIDVSAAIGDHPFVRGDSSKGVKTLVVPAGKERGNLWQLL